LSALENRLRRDEAAGSIFDALGSAQYKVLPEALPNDLDAHRYPVSNPTWH